MGLKKAIGLFDGVSILAGIMIGSGIYAFAGLILFRSFNNLALSLLVWIIGGIITLFSALTYGELGTMFPETGGYYVYLKKAYGKRIAFLSGVMNFVLSSSGSIALLAIIFGDILGNYVLGLNGWTRGIAAFMIVGLSLINYLGIKWGSMVQKIFLIAKILPMLVIIIMGLFLGKESISLSFSSLEGVPFWTLWVGIGYAVIGTLWSYEGWTNLNTMTGEMKNVKKDLPRALSWATLLVTLVYLLFIYALYRILSYQTLLDLGAGGFLPIAAMMTLFGQTGMMFVFIAVLISIFGALNGSIMVFPRVYYAMAEDGLFPKAFRHVNSKRSTPTWAILGSGLMALLLILFNIEQLLTFVVMGGLIFNTLIFISVFLFRKREPNRVRPYRVWGYPFVPIIAILGMVMLLIATAIQSLVPSLIGLGVLIIGYFLYPYLMKKQSR